VSGIVRPSYEKTQKFFIKSAFLFKQVHLQCIIPSTSNESIKLYTPEGLFEQSGQIGAIQYGGIKYPYIENKPLQLSFIEVRLEGQFLKSLGIYDDINHFMVDVVGKVG